MQYVSYLRVSTADQADKGYSFTAQRFKIERFLEKGDSVVREYRDVASGKTMNRPTLHAAAAFAANNDAVLITSSMDRLGRNAVGILQWVGFSEKTGRINASQERTVVLADQPHTRCASDRLTWYLNQATFVSIFCYQNGEKTKDGLRRAREQGRKGGNPNPTSAGQLGNAAYKLKVALYSEGLRIKFNNCTKAGCKKPEEYAKMLQDFEVMTFTGKRSWSRGSVSRVLGHLKPGGLCDEMKTTEELAKLETTDFTDNPQSGQGRVLLKGG